MAGAAAGRTPAWTWIAPILALALLGISKAAGAAASAGFGAALLALLAAALLGAVFAGVHHAEVIAHRVGEPFGTLVLAVAGVVSLALYALFVFVQTVRHPGDFLPDEAGDGKDAGPAEPAATHPATRTVLASAVLLPASLAAVVLLAKALAPALEAGVDRIGAPKAAVGVVIAALVLLPEGIAAVRAARADRLQTSLNLALGSALASIGLTIPAVAAYAVLAGRQLVLGLEPKETALLALTLLVSVLTLGTGRTTVLQGGVHLVIFAAFLFLTVVP